MQIVRICKPKVYQRIEETFAQLVQPYDVDLRYTQVHEQVCMHFSIEKDYTVYIYYKKIS